MSRVKDGNSVFLRDFKTDYIKANPDVEKKLTSMMVCSPYTFKKVNLNVQIYEDGKELKIGYINTNDLFSSASADFINSHYNLQALDLLVVADTRLTNENSIEVLARIFCNWKIINRFDSNDEMKHMGMILMQPLSSSYNIDDIKIRSKEGWKRYGSQKMIYVQTYRLSIESNFKLGFVYIRETPNLDETKCLCELFQNTDVLIGDFNLDPERNLDTMKLKMLCGASRVRSLQEYTTNHFNQLDHVIVNQKLSHCCYSSSFINQTSDHRIITIRIPMDQQPYQPVFLENAHYNQGCWTRIPTKFKPPISSPVTSYDQLNLSDIDDYVDLLKENSRCSIFHIQFSINFMKSKANFDSIETSYKDICHLEAASVIMPFQFTKEECEESLDFLIIWSGNNLQLYLHETEVTTVHQQILQIVDKGYISKLFRSFSKSPPILTHTVIASSKSIPSKDVWIYLLTIAKYHALGKSVPEDLDLERDRSVLKRELRAKTIFKQLNPIPKRESEKNANTDSPPSKRTKLCTTPRSFKNLDAESCWINSCLQALLTSLDHCRDVSSLRSPLGDILLWLKDSVKRECLDPSIVKELIYAQEKQRIVTNKVSPESRLFHFSNTISFGPDELELEIQPRGQQDSKDFFICLNENQNAWPDVYNLFKFSLSQYTKCSSCLQVSCQNASFTSQQMFLNLTPPIRNMKISEFISATLEKPNYVTNWKHEDGCGQVTNGENHMQIVDASKMNFLIVIMERLMMGMLIDSLNFTSFYALLVFLE